MLSNLIPTVFLRLKLLISNFLTVEPLAVRLVNKLSFLFLNMMKSFVIVKADIKVEYG